MRCTGALVLNDPAYFFAFREVRKWHSSYYFHMERESELNRLLGTATMDRIHCVSSSPPDPSSPEPALLQAGHTLLASTSFQVSWNS